MGNLALTPKKRISPFRKVALGTWRNAYDPSVYGVLTVRMEEALRYIEAYRKKTGRHLTVSHMMGKALGVLLKQVPDANAVIRWNRIYLRNDIRIFFQVVAEDPDSGEIDLSGVVLREPQDKSLSTIIDEFGGEVKSVRDGTDSQLKKSRNMMKAMPYLLVHYVMRFLSFLMFTLNLNLSKLGIPRDPFGSIMVTNIGSLGLPTALVPLVPYSRVALLVALGSVEERAVVENGQVVPGKVMDLGCTFDHRILDGGHASKMYRIVKDWLEHPFDHFEPIDELRSGKQEAPSAPPPIPS